ncbi:MAG: Antitoxin [Verrucomicrobiales bacterium]|nr:Antitoxin [Verrucomicrobiales bacterium]
MHKGKPVSVILPIREYEAILERLGDFEDLAWLQKVQGKPQSFRPFEEYLADRRKSQAPDSS